VIIKTTLRDWTPMGWPPPLKGTRVRIISINAETLVASQEDATVVAFGPIRVDGKNIWIGHMVETAGGRFLPLNSLVAYEEN